MSLKESTVEVRLVRLMIWTLTLCHARWLSLRIEQAMLSTSALDSVTGELL